MQRHLRKWDADENSILLAWSQWMRAWKCDGAKSLQPPYLSRFLRLLLLSSLFRCPPLLLLGLSLCSLFSASLSSTPPLYSILSCLSSFRARRSIILAFLLASTVVLLRKWRS